MNERYSVGKHIFYSKCGVFLTETKEVYGLNILTETFVLSLWNFSIAKNANIVGTAFWQKRKYLQSSQFYRFLKSHICLSVIIISRTSFTVNLHSIVWLNVKELLTQSKCHIWSVTDRNKIQTHNHLVCKRTFSHFAKVACLAKWLSVRLRVKWLWVRISLLSLFVFVFKSFFC